MFILGNFVFAIAQVINYILSFYMWIIVIRAMLSWVSPDPYNPIVRLIHNITEPVLYQIRKRLPLQTGGIDFSPIAVVVIIVFLQSFVVSSLMTIAGKIR